MSNTSLWVGVDISKDHLDVTISPTGSHYCYTNSTTGIAELLDNLDARVTLIVMEASGGHEKPVLRSLQQVGWPVALVNARKLRNYARARGILAKTDKIDADVLAHYAQTIQPVPSQPLRAEQYRLKSLVKRKRQVTSMIAQEKNRLEHMDDPDLLEEIRAHLTILEQKRADFVQEIEAHIAADQAMARRYEILRSCKGVGPVLASVLIADMPELGMIDHRKAKALAGLAPLNHDSGKQRGRRHIAGGRNYVRQCLYSAVMSACRYNPDIKVHYERKIARGKSTKEARIECADKLLCTLNALLRDNRMWQA